MNSIPYFAVCDDDEIVCEAVSNKVKNYFELCGIEVKLELFTSAMILYDSIKKNEKKFDALFLDISMPKLNGVELAEKVKILNKEIDIIFISSREDKVFETFKVLPFGFVRKTNFSNDIINVLKLYIEKRIMSDTFIAVKSNNNSVIQKVNVNSIVYIESFRYKQFIYLENGDVIECRMTLEDFESKLAKNDITKVYKGYLINLKFVKKIENKGIIMNYNEGVFISISRSKVQEIKTKYLNYLRKTGTIVFEENE